MRTEQISMSLIRRGWLISASLLAGCGSEVEKELSRWEIGESVESYSLCERAGSTFPFGDEPDAHVIVSDRAQYCDVLAIPVATLLPALDGNHPDPGPEVVAAPDGRFFSTSTSGRQIIEWAPDGAFVRAIGISGDGPGEFSPRGRVKPFVGPGDSLFVLDGASRWSVFDSNLEYQRSFSGRYTGRDLHAIHLVEGRGILTTGSHFPDLVNPLALFLWTSFEGDPISSFGIASEEDSWQSFGGSRVSGVTAEGGFWVAPPNGSPIGIVLEHWSIDGFKVGTIERSATWLPPHGYDEPGGTTEPSLPEYEQLAVDSNGFLWLALVARDQRWRALPPDEMQVAQEELYDARIEVIDPMSATTVASFRIEGPSEEQPPFSRFLTGRRGYRVVPDSNGLNSVEIFDIFLVEPRVVRK